MLELNYNTPYSLRAMNKSKQLHELDLLVRAGEFAAARELFSSINRVELSQEDFPLYANIAWRIGEAEQGLRLLASNVRQADKIAKACDNQSLSEYANCLTALGCTQEALALLKSRQQKSDKKLFTDTWLLQAQAFALIAEWEYENALQCLEVILTLRELPSYQNRVAEVNLLACLVFLEHWDLALEKLLEKLADKNNPLSPRLRMNLQGLLLQTYVMTERWQEAQVMLANTNIGEFSAPDVLIIEKWHAVLKARMRNTHTDELYSIRAKAKKAGRWEIVRDCDFHIATITGNKIFFQRVYFATPFKSFREKIARHFQVKFDIPASFDYWLQAENSITEEQPKFELNIAEGRLGDLQLKLGMSNHALLKLLSFDLYKPQSLGGLFHGLFSNEYYDPVNSPNRIHQQIKSLRAVFTENKLPLQISEESSRYQLKALVLTAIRLNRTAQIRPAYQTRLAIIRPLLGDQFTKSDVVAQLKCSAKTAQRILTEGIESGLCLKSGQGKATKYIWKS
jgi:hypothetical protein